MQRDMSTYSIAWGLTPQKETGKKNHNKHGSLLAILRERDVKNECADQRSNNLHIS